MAVHADAASDADAVALGIGLSLESSLLHWLAIVSDPNLHRTRDLPLPRVRPATPLRKSRMTGCRGAIVCR